MLFFNFKCECRVPEWDHPTHHQMLDLSLLSSPFQRPQAPADTGSGLTRCTRGGGGRQNDGGQVLGAISRKKMIGFAGLKDPGRLTPGVCRRIWDRAIRGPNLQGGDFIFEYFNIEKFRGLPMHSGDRST